VRARELNEAAMVLFPPQSNMRKIIDAFFRDLKIAPRVIMEAADTEVIKCMVEAGFGYSVLPAYALVNSQGFFQTLRIAGHRLVRKQALATSYSNYTRSLTAAVIDFLKRSLDQ
jgi:DNA-binding transcriptional LysR family regulator